MAEIIQGVAEVDSLRENIMTALMRGDYEQAQSLIVKLEQFSFVEAGGLRVATYIEEGKADEALTAWGQLNDIVPNEPYTIFLRARIHLLMNERQTALDLIETILNKPMPPVIAEKAFNLAGQCCRFLGMAKKAVEYYKIAVKFAPDLELKALNYSNYLFNRHYLANTPQADLTAGKGYGKLFQGRDAISEFLHSVAIDNNKPKLHVGYISPDFREHVVLAFSYALLSKGDDKIYTTVYAVGKEDNYTQSIKNSVDNYRNLIGLTPKDMARIIYEDEVDILVDLAGHTSGNILPALAYKPAPLIVSGIGYFSTTGLDTVDYFLADEILAGGKARTGFTEKLLPLKSSHFCYTPLRNEPLPKRKIFGERAYIVFGSFNNFSKVNDRVLATWAKIMERVPQSRLFFKAEIFNHEDSTQVALARINKAGIDLARVSYEGTGKDYLARYGEVDIALDTFPYPGGGTTADALYMGVPVITLTGDTLGERFGESLLTNIGLSELVARTETEYIELAVSLAKDTSTVVALHQGLRHLLKTSPVMDRTNYQRELHQAYASIWQDYQSELATLEPLTYMQIRTLNAQMDAFLKADDNRQAIMVARRLIAGNIHDCRIYERLAKSMLEVNAQAEAEQAGERLLALAIKEGNYHAQIIAAYALEKSLTADEIIHVLDNALANSAELSQEDIGMAYQLLARMMRIKGDSQKEIQYYLKSSEYKSVAMGKYASYSNALFAMHYGNFSREEYLRLAKGYDTVLMTDIGNKQYQHETLKHKRHKKIRLGYISPDFCRHVVAVFAKALFTHYDKNAFEVYAYSLAESNEISEKFAKAIGKEHFRYVADMLHEDIAKLIYEDEIDILVDLAGHTGNNPLPILAYKPAPVQLSGIGYFATTGLSTVDYFLVDKYTAPVGEEEFFTEKLLRLPASHLCYQNIQVYNYPNGVAPFIKNNYITFGSLANPNKITDAMLTAWQKIMSAIPHSRLLLKSAGYDDDIKRSDIINRMTGIGLDTARVKFEGQTDEYLSAYYNIDIVLDTFPYPGGGTTADALYMGVPVITLKGSSHHRRFGESLLNNAGLADCIAEDMTDYVAKAIKLAEDKKRLAYLHGILRQQFLASSAGNPARYMAELELAYQHIWQEYSASKGQMANKSLADIREQIYAYIETAKHNHSDYARAEVLVAIALADEAKHLNEELLYLLTYSQERQGKLMSALRLAEEYLSINENKLKSGKIYSEFLQLKANIDFKIANGRASESYYNTYNYFAKSDMPSRKLAWHYSNYLVALHNEDISAEELYEEHKAYSNLLDGLAVWSHDVSTRSKAFGKRKIRIGYLSADFRRHVMQTIYMTLFTDYDKNNFEVYAYSLTQERDSVTAKLATLVDYWRDVSEIADDSHRVAGIIAEDNLDILVDLGGHSAGGTLTVMAYRPARVQLSGLGYMSTTGLKTIDYFLTDKVVDIAGESDKFFNEKLIRLSSQFCYTPVQDNLPINRRTPARDRGWVLFGVFNQYRKFNDEMIKAWGEILTKVPGAKLLIKSQVLFAPEMIIEAYNRFDGLGVDMSRVIFEGATTDYMERYLDVDIALDTYPWVGGATTLDALYMGVPVITRYDVRRGTRFGLSMLTNIDMQGLAVADLESYIERAVALANDMELLDILHSGLRSMLRNSPLLDGKRYMQELENHYKAIIM